MTSAKSKRIQPRSHQLFDATDRGGPFSRGNNSRKPRQQLRGNLSETENNSRKRLVPNKTFVSVRGEKLTGSLALHQLSPLHFTFT